MDSADLEDEKTRAFDELNRKLSDLYYAEMAPKSAFDRIASKRKMFGLGEADRLTELKVAFQNDSLTLGLESNYFQARVIALEQIALLEEKRQQGNNTNIENYSERYNKLEIIKEFYLGEGKKLDQRTTSELSELENGPLDKNYFTDRLEALVKGMIRGNDFIVEKNKNNEYIVIMDDERYNVNQILKHANFSHLSLSEEDKEHFLTMLSKHGSLMPAINGLDKNKNFTRSSIPKEDLIGMTPEEQKMYYFEKMDQKFIENIDNNNKGKKDEDKDESLKHLHKAERIALNIYSGPFYGPSNAALRGDLDTALNDFSGNGDVSNKLRELICTSALIQNALSTVPDMNAKDEYAYRMEKSIPPEILKERLDAAEKQGIIDTKGAISTKDKTPELNAFFSQVGMVLKGARGKKIAMISNSEGENEILYPAGQIRYIGVLEGKKKDNNIGDNGERTIFMAQAVVTLTGLSVESKLTKRELENSPGIKILIDEKNQLKDIKKHEKDPETLNVINSRLNEIHEEIDHKISEIVKAKQEALKPKRPERSPLQPRASQEAVNNSPPSRPERPPLQSRGSQEAVNNSPPSRPARPPLQSRGSQEALINSPPSRPKRPPLPTKPQRPENLPLQSKISQQNMPNHNLSERLNDLLTNPQVQADNMPKASERSVKMHKTEEHKLFFSRTASQSALGGHRERTNVNAPGANNEPVKPPLTSPHNIRRP